MTISTLRARRQILQYENPYNAGGKRVFRTSVWTLLGFLLFISFLWIALLLQLRPRIKENNALSLLPNRKAAALEAGLQVEPPHISNKLAKPKRFKDTHDYRTIKIETPAPRTKHDNIDLEFSIANLTAHNPIFVGREKLVGMLLEMYIDPTQIENSIWEQVPTWDEITAVHGSQPVVFGLESCPTFRETVTPLDRHVGIAGMFNTGTNLLAILLQHNCAIPEGIAKWGRKKGHGMEWQVPWGKHTPEWYRGKANVKNFIGKIPYEHMFVASMVRHPYDWMTSMCRNGYTVKWEHTRKNCPNLYDGNGVYARFGPGPSNHSSLVHMWNDWNGAYFRANYPRALVRFEDTIFFPKETSKIICDCVGGKLMPPKEQDGLFHYVIDSAKVGPGHGAAKKRNGLIDAWIKYGKTPTARMSQQDMEFSVKHLDHDIVNALNWTLPR